VPVNTFPVYVAKLERLSKGLSKFPSVRSLKLSAITTPSSLRYFLDVSEGVIFVFASMAGLVEESQALKVPGTDAAIALPVQKKFPLGTPPKLPVTVLAVTKA
jgi:hypothetical protein